MNKNESETDRPEIRANNGVVINPKLQALYDFLVQDVRDGTHETRHAHMERHIGYLVVRALRFKTSPRDRENCMQFAMKFAEAAAYVDDHHQANKNADMNKIVQRASEAGLGEEWVVFERERLKDWYASMLDHSVDTLARQAFLASQKDADLQK